MGGCAFFFVVDGDCVRVGVLLTFLFWQCGGIVADNNCVDVGVLLTVISFLLLRVFVMNL